MCNIVPGNNVNNKRLASITTECITIEKDSPKIESANISSKRKAPQQRGNRSSEKRSSVDFDALVYFSLLCEFYCQQKRYQHRQSSKITFPRLLSQH